MEYILRIDSDDKIVKGRSKKQFEYLVANNDVAVVGSQVLFIDENSRIIGRSEYKAATFFEEFGFGCRIAGPSVMFRKSLILSCGNYKDICILSDRSICEDFDLWLRVLEEYKLAILDEALTEYRIHSSQATQIYEVETFLCSMILRSRKILHDAREQINPKDLRIDSTTLRDLMTRMKKLGTPESNVWLLDYSIFLAKNYADIVRRHSAGRFKFFCMNIDLLLFAIRYLLTNKGSYEREIEKYRSELPNKY
jgi:hypothetical protein